MGIQSVKSKDGIEMGIYNRSKARIGKDGISTKIYKQKCERKVRAAVTQKIKRMATTAPGGMVD